MIRKTFSSIVIILLAYSTANAGGRTTRTITTYSSSSSSSYDYGSAIGAAIGILQMAPGVIDSVGRIVDSVPQVSLPNIPTPNIYMPVSYTHLTLPTIL